jgi:hypothetical protein
MSRLTQFRARGRLAVLATAVALFAAVFVARLVSDDPSNGLAFLYVLPIIMLATEFGVGAAMVGAVSAVGLVMLWSSVAGIGIHHVGFAVRLLVFVLVGALCAQMAERVRRTT